MEQYPRTSVLKFLIVLYISVALWFMFAPDTLADGIKWAERMEDKSYYVLLDNLIIYIYYIQMIACVALWRPNKLAAYFYLFTVIAIGVLGAFGGAAALSAIDSMMSYLQTLAIGATLLWLYIYKRILPSTPF